MKLVIAFCASLVLIAAADFGQPTRATAQPPPSGRSCFWPRSIRGFRSIDNRVVYMRVSRNDVYALEFFAPCLGVDWAHGVGLRSRSGGTICEGRGNAVELVVRDGRAFGRQRCIVSNVRRLSPAEVASLPPSAIP